MKTHIRLSLLIVLLLAIFVPSFVYAAPLSIVPNCARSGATTQTPGLECIVLTIINVAQLILGISGSVALALFAYGGFLMLISAGSEKLVIKGKDVLKGALVGLIIVFGAYAGIVFLIRVMTSGSKDIGTLLQCINVNTGEYKPRGEDCGTGGKCFSGVCVSKAP